MKILSYKGFSFGLLIILVLYACDTDSGIQTIEVKKFPYTIDLAFTQESKDDIFHYAYEDLKIVNNHIIVVDSKSEDLLRVLDKTSLEYLFSKLKKGKGNDELLLPRQLQVEDNYLYLVDIMTMKFYKYNLDLLSKKKFSTPEKVYKLPLIAINDAKLIRDSKILVTGWIDDGLVEIYDTLGSKIKVVGNIPKGNPIGELSVGQFNTSNIFEIDLFPDHKKFIVYSLFSDNLQIFNAGGTEKINITGPDFIEPQFRYVHKAFLIEDESKLGYIDVVIKKKYIYALYLGVSQKEMGNMPELTTSIFVFKHNGSPVARFNLDKNIKTFDVDEGNGIFYTLQLTPNQIFKYNYEIN